MTNKRKLSDIKRSNDPYDLKSRKRLENNIERKFKKVFGTSLYLLETIMREHLESNPDAHREFKKEILRVGNMAINNMRKELACYNVTYIPFHIEMRALGAGENGND
jgi:hypothetical protein